MKKTIIYLTVFLLLISCTKQELVVVDQPITIDGKSDESQAFLKERALEFIKMYRFEKVPEVFEQITSQDIIDDLKKSWAFYLAKAKEEAFVLVTEANDTLYYKHIGTENPSAVTNLSIDYSARPAHQPNAKGRFYGFERYPNLTTVTLTNSMATEFADFSQTPKLRQFTWTTLKVNFEYWYPNEEFVVPAPKIDFSTNTALTNLTFSTADLSNITFPSHKVTLVRINSSKVPDRELNRISAVSFTIDRCETENPDLVLTNKNIDGFSYQFGNAQSIDIQATNLKTLNVNGTGGFRRLIPNDQLENLQVANTIGLDREYVLEADKLPKSMKSIYISPGSVSNADFSHLTNLTSLNFQGDSKLYFNTLTLPSTLLTTFTIANLSVEQLDISKANALTTATITNVSTEWVKLPNKIRSLSIQGNDKMANLDLSSLNANNEITRLLIQDNSKLQEIILPINLTQTQFTNISSNLKFVVKRNCQFINKPSWLDNYITYID